VIVVPHVVLGAVAPDGTPPLPAMLGEIHVWRERNSLTIGECPAWEFRDEANAAFATLQLVATLSPTRAVWLAWVPGDVRDGAVAPLFASFAGALEAVGALEAYWPVDSDGGVSQVDSPEVLAAWPAAWRQRTAVDLPADGADPGALLPTLTGPRIVGAALA
jgi:hypothetical protein